MNVQSLTGVAFVAHALVGIGAATSAPIAEPIANCEATIADARTTRRSALRYFILSALIKNSWKQRVVFSHDKTNSKRLLYISLNLNRAGICTNIYFDWLSQPYVGSLSPVSSGRQNSHKCASFKPAVGHSERSEKRDISW